MADERTGSSDPDASLLESERQFRILAEALPLGVYRLDRAGRMIYANRHWCEINGTDSFGKGQGWRAGVHPDDRERVHRAARRSIANRTLMSLQHRVLRPDGSVRITASDATPIFEDDEFQGWVGTTRDITEHAEALALTDRLVAILEATPDIAGISDARGHLTFLNRAGRDFFGLGPDESLDDVPARDMVLPEVLSDLEVDAEGARDRGHGGFRIETTLVNREGGELPVSLVGVIHRDDDDVTEFVSVIARDISAIREVQEELVRREEWARILALHAADMVLVIGADGVPTYVSPSWAGTLGWTADDIAQRRVREVSEPASVAAYDAAVAKALRKPGEVVRFEARLPDTSGIQHDLEIELTNLLDDPTIHGILYNGRDVTKRRMAEREQERALGTLRSLVSSSPVSISMLDRDGVVRFWSQSSEELLGWTADEVVGVGPPGPHVPPDGVTARNRSVERILTGEVVVEDVRRRCKDGSLIDVAVHGSPIRDPDGEITAIVVVASDITDRKRAEDALRESEERFRALVAASGDLTLVVDAEGIVSYVSPSSLEFLGLREKDVIGRVLGDDQVHPDDRERVWGDMARIIDEPGASTRCAFRSRRADGEFRWLESVITNQLDNPAVRGVVTNSFDVTERVEALESLRDTNERVQRTNKTLSAIVNGSPLPIAVVAPSGVVEVWNPAAEALFGWTADEVEGARDPSLPEGFEAEFDEIRLRLANGESVDNLETRRRRRDGRDVDVLLSAAPIVDESGRSAAWVALMADITERKKAEEAVRVADQRFRSLVQNASDVITIVDADARVLFTTTSKDNSFGYDPDEMIGSDIHELVHPDDRAWVRQAFENRLREGGIGPGTQHRLLSASGEWVDIESVAVNLLDDPAIGGIVLTTRDVSDRKRAEERLRQSEERLRTLVANVSDLITVVDRVGNVLFTSETDAMDLGYEPDESVGMNIFDLLHPDDRERAEAAFVQQIGAEGHGPPNEYRIRRKDGSYLDVETIGLNLLDDPSIGGVVFTTRDISERKRAAESLRQSEERFKALVQNTSDAIAVIASNGDLLYASPSTRELVGDTTSAPEVMALLHPDDVDRVVAEFTALRREGKFRSLQFRLRTPAGSTRVVEMMAEDHSDDPAIGGVVTTTRDITEREESEQALRDSEARYRAIVEDQAELICRWTEAGEITFANLAFARALGTVPERLIGRNIFDLAPGDAKLALRRGIQLTVPGQTRTEEAPLDIPGMSRRWAHWTLRAISGHATDDEGHEYQVVGLDVTERRKAEHSAEQQSRILEMIARGNDKSEVFEELCRMLEAGIPDARAAVFLFDADVSEVQEFVAPSVPEEYIRFIRADFQRLITDEVRELFRVMEIVASRDFARVATADTIDSARAAGIFSTWAVPVRSAQDGELLGTVAVFDSRQRDRSESDERVALTVANLVAIAEERAHAEAELSHQALHDPLTGLPNRALFMDRLNQSLARSRRARTSSAVLFLDLDRFKTINDSLGHETGDQLLVAVARRLEAVLRPGDTVARFGGDEFTILCDELVDQRGEALEIAERLLDAIVRPFPLSGNEEAYLTASIGVSLARADDRPGSVLRDADAAMYRAKEEGKARHVVFDDAMRASAVARLETETALHRAIEREEFEIFYQPIVSLRDARCAGAEALVRWHHPERGLVSPVDFINLAEETGLIVRLGAWVLDEVCRQAAVWQAQAPADDPFVVTANLSARQLSNAALVDQVASALTNSGADPSRIALEITEDVLMDDTAAAMQTLSELEALGVALGVDDFGTGYSSLGYLKRLPVSLVKIDRSFVAGLGRDSEDSAIVTAVVSLAEALDMQVVAEGVETSEQLAELLSLGCDLAQGFFFAPPQPAADLETLVGRGRRWRPPGSSLIESVDHLASHRRRSAPGSWRGT
ncbi:MAG: PAS domain S-box protein [Acidimicrobiia bacterium]